MDFRSELIKLIRRIGPGMIDTKEIGAACLSMACIVLTEKGYTKQSILASVEILIDEAIKNRKTLIAN